MKKRLLSFFLVLICVCSFSLSAFAKNIENITDKDKAEIAQNPYLWYAKNQMLGVEDGTGVTLVCPNGDYSTLYTGGTLVSCPYDGEALVLASAGGVQAKKYTPGGGSADGSSGVGRSDLGYTEDNKPLVSHDGSLVVMAEPYGVSYYFGDGFTTSVPAMAALASNGTGGGTTYPGSTNLRAAYRFTAPVTGLYYVGSGGSPYNLGFCDFAYGDSWKRIDFTFTYTSTLQYKITLSKGDVAYLLFPRTFANAKNAAFKFSMKNCPISVDVLSESSITNYNKYTINKNQWNGNIYVDNSKNLTYIYPQYTTINNEGDTITNISNNPIIYNNTTNEYYTYDTITNNYYYITYETPTPSPSPDPDPTPTPTPGGDIGDTNSLLDVLVQIRDNMIQGFADIKATLVQGWADLSANFTLAIENLNLNITNIFNKKFPDQSTPETAKPSPSPSPSPSPDPSPSPSPDPSETPTPTPAPTDKPNNGGNTNNFWNFVFPGGNDDGTENGHKGILWALISLLIAVVTFVLGLGSAYAYVFPFLPAGLVTTIHICVLVLLLFAIIKFVRSFL